MVSHFKPQCHKNRRNLVAAPLKARFKAFSESQVKALAVRLQLFCTGCKELYDEDFFTKSTDKRPVRRYAHRRNRCMGCEQEALDEEKQDDRFLVKARTPTEPWGLHFHPGPTMQADEGNDLLHPTKVRIPRRAMRARYLGIDHGRDKDLAPGPVPDLVGSKYSCSVGIIPKEASQTLPAFHTIGGAGSVSRLGEQQNISLALMGTLGMKMCKVFVQRSP